MKTIELTLARIGNSRGIRLPAALIRQHGLDSGMLLEDRGHELVLRPKGRPRKLSWEDTANEMVADASDWNDWDCISADGLDSIPWDHPTSAARSKMHKKPAAKVRSSRKP